MKIKKIYLKISAAVMAILLPFLASAQGNNVEQGLGGIRSIFGTNRFTSSRDVITFIGEVIKLGLTIAGVIAVLFAIIGGFQYITSGGNEEQAEKGRKTLINAVIGIVIIVLSYVIINAIVGTLRR